MTTLVAPIAPPPIIDRLRGLICILVPRRKTAAAARTRVEYRCPEPTSRWFRCRRPLPCTSHAIATLEDAWSRHGYVIAKIVKERA